MSKQTTSHSVGGLKALKNNELLGGQCNHKTLLYSSVLKPAWQKSVFMHKRQSLLQNFENFEGLKDISSSHENLDPGVYLKELTSVKLLIL